MLAMKPGVFFSKAYFSINNTIVFVYRLFEMSFTDITSLHGKVRLDCIYGLPKTFMLSLHKQVKKAQQSNFARA